MIKTAGHQVRWRRQQIAFDEADRLGQAAFLGAVSGQSNEARVGVKADNADAFEARRQRQRRRAGAGARIEHRFPRLGGDRRGQQYRVDGGAVAAGRLQDRHPTAEQSVAAYFTIQLRQRGGRRSG